MPPAARRALTDLKAGDRVEDEIFRIVQKDLRTSANGGMYIHAVLADQSGQMVARMWNATQAYFDSIGENGLMHLRGRVESYKGKPQFIIDGLRSVEPGTVNASDFLPRTRHDVDQMWKRLLEILGRIAHPGLAALVTHFTGNAAFAQRFRSAPAARNLHHAYIGGLLEHTLNLLELAELVLPRYPEVSADLVRAGIFFHDSGKTAELSYETSFDYTSEGQLLGHIVQACTWVHEAARRLAESGTPLPRDVLAALQHIIVAHHGSYEFGSPRLPATPEAFMVHYLDNLDAKLNMVFAAIAGDADESNDWTQWVQALQTRVFKPDVLRTRERPDLSDAR